MKYETLFLSVFSFVNFQFLPSIKHNPHSDQENSLLHILSPLFSDSLCPTYVGFFDVPQTFQVYSIFKMLSLPPDSHKAYSLTPLMIMAQMSPFPLNPGPMKILYACILLSSLVIHNFT